MNITLRQLRAFVEVSHRKGFTAAARHLHITQSALSHLIRELENQVGLRLLDRSTHSIALTPAGAELLQNADRILGETELAIASLRDLAAKRRGRITVAAPPVIAASLMPIAMVRFKHTYPEVNIRLMDVLTAQILDAVRSGEADFGVGTFRQTEAEVQLEPLYEDRLIAVLPAASSLVRKRRIGWKDLRGHPLVMLSTGSAFHYLVDRAATQAGIPSNPAYEVGYMGTAIALVEAGLGITVLPAYASGMIDPRKAAIRPVEGPVVTREVCIALRVGRSLTPAAAEFAAVVRAICHAGEHAGKSPSLRGLPTA